MFIDRISLPAGRNDAPGSLNEGPAKESRFRESNHKAVRFAVVRRSRGLSRI